MSCTAVVRLNTFKNCAFHLIFYVFQRYSRQEMVPFNEATAHHTKHE